MSALQLLEKEDDTGFEGRAAYWGAEIVFGFIF
jgi:hypothetical protein